MATWKPENVLLTLKGNEALSKVLAGQGKLTVTRIVTGAGYVPPSTLYNQKNVSDIKQTLEISRVVTDANGSEISTTLSNINLDTAYSLYQIGVYCRYTDSDEEFLYLIAQCETDKPDTIPAKTDTIANFSYNLYIQHEGTTQFEVTVNQSGVLDVSMLGKPSGVAGLDSGGILPKEVIPNASKIYLSDGITSVEEAIANSGGAFIATYGTTTSAEIEAAYQKGKAVFCSYNNKLIPLVVRVSATNHQFYTGSLYCDALGNTKGLFLLCNNSIWSNDAEVVPYRHSSMHSIDGSDPITPASIGAAASTHASQHASGGSDPITAEQVGALRLHGWQAATDFNALTESGIYQCQGVNLNTPYGSDADTHFHVMVFRHSDQWIRQVAYDVRGQNCYTRAKTNNVWSSWQQIMLGSDVTSLMAGKQDASTAINTGNIGSQNVNYSSYSAYAGHGSRGTPGTSCLRDISAGTSDLTAGSSALTSGNIYLVYE